MTTVSGEGHKLSEGFGVRTSTSLLEQYKSLAPELTWKNADILDIGCHWGYLQRLLCEKENVKSAYGVDSVPRWEDSGFEPEDPRLKLFCGDVTKLPELQSLKFDIIVSSGTLMTVPMRTLDLITSWIYDHLNDSGSALIRVRTYLSYCGGDLVDLGKCDVHYGHLLFGKPVLKEFLGQEPRQMIPFSASSWGMYFFRQGFEIVNVVRHSNSYQENLVPHADKLQYYDEQELGTGEVSFHLRRSKGDFLPGSKSNF